MAVRDRQPSTTFMKFSEGCIFPVWRRPKAQRCKQSTLRSHWTACLLSNRDKWCLGAFLPLETIAFQLLILLPVGETEAWICIVLQNQMLGSLFRVPSCRHCCRASSIPSHPDLDQPQDLEGETLILDAAGEGSQLPELSTMPMGTNVHSGCPSSSL